MNKAFVKESDNDDDDDLPQAQALPAGTKNYMTPEGYERLRGELAHLMNVERPSVVQVVSWAASNGDRSENGDYLYGKKRLREIDRRMRFLTKRLDIAEVVDPAIQPNRDQVFSAPPCCTRTRPARTTPSPSSGWTRPSRWPARSAGSRPWRADQGQGRRHRAAHAGRHRGTGYPGSTVSGLMRILASKRAASLASPTTQERCDRGRAEALPAAAPP